MNLQEIHSKLSEKFGDAIVPWAEPEAGDPWIEVSPEHLHEVMRFLRDDPAMRFDFLRCVSGVDWVEWVESVYHLLSYDHDHEATIKVKLDAKRPKVRSVADIWPAADWHEREAFDMIGIKYLEHPELRRILLPDDWEGHPLRKDYQQPDSYHGISNW